MRKIWRVYIHERKTWPEFHWDENAVSTLLAEVSRRQGRLVGRMEGLGFKLRTEATLQTLTEDVIKSSDIEGEVLDRDQVRSLIARRLGMDIAGLVPSDRHVDGVVEMLLDATRHYDAPLTQGRLFGWHAAFHPFEDGNGRMARAENSRQRFSSLSAQIRAQRNACYDILESTRKGDLDITE